MLTCTTALAATPDEILAATAPPPGADAARGKAAVVMQFDYAGNGLTGTAGGTSDLSDGHFEQRFAVGPMTGANGYDGAHGLEQGQFRIVTLQEAGDAVPLAVNNAYRNANLWWLPDHGGATIVEDPQKTETARPMTC